MKKKISNYIYFLRFSASRLKNLSLKKDRSSLVFKNIINAFFYRGLGIIISLILVPLSIAYVGAVEYGVWLTVSSVASWMNQFDFGLGNGLRNQLTRDSANKEFDNARVYVSSIYAIMILISLGFLLLYLVLNQFVDWSILFNIPDSISSSIKTVVFLVIISFCLQFILQLLHTLLTAVHLNYKSHLVNTVALVISLFGMSALYYFSESNLLLLVLILGFSPVISVLFFTLYYFLKDLKLYIPSIEKIHFEKSKTLISTGGMFFLTQICSLALYQSSNLIIAKILGHEEVAIYNVVYKYFTALFMIVSVILNPYWTGFAEAFGLNDYAWIKKSMIKLRKIFLLFIVLNLICLVISPFVFDLWIGDKLIIPFEATMIISFYFMTYFWLNIHMTLIYGVGKLRVLVYLIVIAAFINVPFSIYLGNLFGLVGIVLANSIVLLLLGMMIFIQSQKIIFQKANGIWFK